MSSGACLRPTGSIISGGASRSRHVPEPDRVIRSDVRFDLLVPGTRVNPVTMVSLDQQSKVEQGGRVFRAQQRSNHRAV